MSSTRIGLIGCGKQAHKHISGLSAIPGVEVVLADSEPVLARSLAEEKGLDWVSEPRRIADDASIRAIDICTPTPSHAELIRMAVESGKDFFVEKPLCGSLGEAHELYKLATDAGRIGMVGYVYRFAPAFEFGRTILEGVPATGTSDVVGRIVTASMRIGGRGSHQLWKHRKDTGGGAISEMMVHMLDLAIWYFGPVRNVDILACDLLRPRRVIRGKEEAVDAEDYVVARLKTAGGVDVLCQADLVTPAFTQFIEVQGEAGSFMASIQPDMPSFLYCCRDVGGYSAGKHELHFEAANYFEAEMAEFVEAVRSRKPPSRRTLQDSILVMEALEMMRNKITDA